jgi:hypothetical protein
MSWRTDVIDAAAVLGHDVAMQRTRSEAEIATWKAGDAARNEHARNERLRCDGARSPGENLAEGAKLARAARAFFGVARRSRS